MSIPISSKQGYTSAARPVWLVSLGVAGLCTLILGYLLFSRIPLNGLWSGDQGAKLIQIMSLVVHKFRSAALIDSAASIDTSQQFSPLPVLFSWKSGQEFFSIFSYPYAALSAIPFFVLGYAGLYLVPLLAIFFTFWLSSLIAKELDLAYPWLMPLLLLCATPIGFYGLVIWEHAPALAAATGGIYLLLRGLRTTRNWQIVLAGFLIGIAYWFRTEALWLFPALALGLLITQPKRLWPIFYLALGGLGSVGLLMLANLWVFGLPLGPSVATNYATPATSSLGQFIALRSSIFQINLLNTTFDLTLVFAALAIIGAGFLPRFGSFLLMIGVGCFVLFVATSHPALIKTGLASSAILLFTALWSARLWRSAAPAQQVLLIASIVYIGGVLVSAPNDGGAQWGPRYLLLAMPMMAVVAYAMLLHLLRQYSAQAQRIERVVYAGSLAVLLLALAFVQLQGVQVLQNSSSQILYINQAVADQGAPVVITDTWYTPQVLAPIYLDHPILWMNNPESLLAARDLLITRGITDFTYLGTQPWPTELSAEQHHLSCQKAENLALDLKLFNCRVENS